MQPEDQQQEAQNDPTLKTIADGASITMKPIPMMSVTSSQINSVGYHADSKTLAIEFKSGAEWDGSHYRYANVEQETYDGLMKAPSVGSYFYKNIRPKADVFPYRKVHTDEVLDEDQAAGEEATV